jgi:hypothetical protein
LFRFAPIAAEVITLYFGTIKVSARLRNPY